MRRLAARRWRNVAVLAVAGATAVFLNAVLATSLWPQAFWSGGLLALLVVVLASYNLRKRLAFLPLGASSTWLQWHIYLGFLSILVFGLHVSWRMPRGTLEIVLALFYVGTAASGVIGLILSRWFARRLTVRGPEVIYERIPRLRARIQSEVEQLVLACVASTDSTAIPEFYEQHLRSFLAGPRNVWRHLCQSPRPWRRLSNESEILDQYLNDNERRTAAEILSLARLKDNLDYQYAHQAVLKYWLFVHVPLTYGLLIFAALHILMVFAFTGRTF